MAGRDSISRLAARMGVFRGYRDFRKIQRRTGAATDRALLAAIGVSVTTRGDAEARLRTLDAEDAARTGPREVILSADAGGRVVLRRPAGWALCLEGETKPAATGGGDLSVDIPPLPPGVHRLTLEGLAGPETVWLIAAPASAPSLAECSGAAKAWGLTGALYGFSSGRNAGLGDYRDLGDMAMAAARHGAAFLGINPVHALGAAAPDGMISPYSPTHRGFLNPWHIALDGLAPYCGEARAAAGNCVPASGSVDYTAAAAVRDPALAAAFAGFAALPPENPIRRRFDAFAAERGAGLQTFARFEALSLRHGGDWRAWPAALRDQSGTAVAEFARAAPAEILFHAWLQWVAHDQLLSAQRTAKASGMGLGLYLDLAVGARPGGAETWMDPGGHITGATLGAPPDAFGDIGQNWGLAPLSPHGLTTSGYRPFIELLRGVMRYAGVIRIDHVLGLMRCFWVPDDGAPGGYVRYPLEGLLAVIAIEARRHGVLVVGEDLGLVPRGFRNRLARAGLYGVEVTQFMRGTAGGLPAPAELRPRSMASFGNHDTPTVDGFFAGRDLDWNLRLGRMTAAQHDAQRREREHLAAQLGAPATKRRLRIHSDLAASTAELVAVQLDDLTGAVEQQNLPGTVHEHPNWRRRSAISVEAAANAPGLREIGAIMRRAGRGSGSGAPDG
ncbi:MAG TPA: 4-alpha-glucanotransferase [Thermohalobaculum sp.]|nr:4-alpha-glucanotransferase [Thermohalobaculum sp.]